MCVGLKSNGSVVTWSISTNGGDTQGKEITGVAHVTCGANHYAGLKNDGSVIAWGNNGRGWNTQGKDVTGVVHVSCGKWYKDTKGKDVTKKSTVSSGVYACVGHKSNGSVTAWGDSC